MSIDGTAFRFGECTGHLCGNEEWLTADTGLCYDCRTDGGTTMSTTMIPTKEHENAVRPHSEALMEYLSADARAMQLNDDADLAVAAEIINDVKDRKKALEEQRKSVTGPIKEGIRRFEAFFKPALDACDGARTLWDGKIRDYAGRQALARAQAEAALQVAVSAGDAQAAAAAVTALVPSERTAGLAIVPAWDFEERNHDIVPTFLTRIDARAVGIEIGRQLMEGVTEPAIPGLRIFRRDIVKAVGR